MAMTATAKTIWLLAIGTALIVLLLVPLRLTPAVPSSIDMLSLSARAQLVQIYDPIARNLSARADTIRQALTRRYGGTRPSQDSLLGDLEDVANQMSQIVEHLRDPRQATFEEKREDIGQWLENLRAEGTADAKQLVEGL